MRYPHTITVTRTAAGTSDGAGGTLADGATSTVYSGRADVQEGRKVYRTVEGAITDEGDATAFLAAAASAVSVADAVTITWEDGSTQAATVAEVNRLDDALTLRYD